MKATINKECPVCEGDTTELSNCCGGQFAEPGWPDNDICGSCGEHSEIHVCETCKGKGFIFSEIKLPKIVENQLVDIQLKENNNLKNK